MGNQSESVKKKVFHQRKACYIRWWIISNIESANNNSTQIPPQNWRCNTFTFMLQSQYYPLIKAGWGRDRKRKGQAWKIQVQTNSKKY